MADSDDPTAATPSDPTRPMVPPPASSEPTAPRQPPPPGGRPGAPLPPGPSRAWRPGQVALIALLTLLLGGTVGILIFTLATDDGDEADEIATATSTTTDPDDAEATTTTEPEQTPTTDAPETTARRNTGNQTVVGNGTFTGSYQSNQDQLTDEFEVGDDWTIRWEVPSGRVVIEVIDAGGGDVVETIEAEGGGQRRIGEEGRYRVDIDTDGSEYSVVITDGP